MGQTAHYMANFRFNAKNAFLTYPHTDLPLEHFIGRSDKYIIARELHQDGSAHVHCYLHFNHKVNTINQAFFDVEGRHPNIQACRSAAAVMAYVTKGCNYITNLTAEEIQKGTIKTKKEELAEKILEEGELTKKLIIENKEVIFLNYENTKKWLALYQGPKTFQGERPKHKQRHIWIWGESNTGKSIQLDRLLKGKLSYNIPSNNDWSGVEGAEILWYDEYRGHMSVQELNSICDGNKRLNTKGGSTSIYYPTIIIVSNFNIHEVYTKSTNTEIVSLHNRFNVYESPLSSLIPK